MNRLAFQLALWAMGLICGGAIVLSSLQARQRLGQPGVRISAEPLLVEKDAVTRTNSIQLPLNIPGYIGRPGPISLVEIGSLPADTTFGRAIYQSPDGFQAQVTVVLMGTDRTSIHRPEYCLTGQGWQIRQKREQRILRGHTDSAGLQVQRFDARCLANQDGKHVELGGVYVFWFVADGLTTANPWQRQWWMIRDLVTRGELQRWAYISFFAPCRPGQEDRAFERITELIRVTVPKFQLSSGPEVL